METFKAKRTKAKDRPLMMVVKNSKKGTCMLVAVMGFTKESNYLRKYFFVS
jgi:hypothetical protein